MRLLALVALSAAIVGAVSIAEEAGSKIKAPDAKPVVVPFEMLRSGHMAVVVKVNGKGPYKLIFDTGAPTTLINNKVAKAAGLLKGKAAPAFTLFGSMGEATIDSLEVGGQKAEKIQAIVMDHPTVEQISRVLNTPIEGIVGFPFFGRFKTTLDYQAKTMTFVPSGYDPPNVMESMMKSLLKGDGPTILAPSTTWGFSAVKGEDIDAPGMTITSVRPDSPAAQAGLKKGDRLLTLDSRWTDTQVDLFQAATGVTPGTEVVLKVKRDGKDLNLRVKPGSGL